MLPDQIEAAARRRFVKWDAQLWRFVLDGPALALAQGLTRAGLDAARAGALLEGYLGLAAEGIGLGYLFPESSGAQSFLTQAFYRLLPAALPGQPPEAAARALADTWNLGENLERSPAWLRRLFVRLTPGPESLLDLERLVADVEARALRPPAQRLAGSWTLHWLHVAEDDPRFLPGAVHFVAPSVACVHDRHRGTAQAGREAVSLGVWLDEKPLLLGAMGCGETPALDPGLDLGLLEEVARRDRRVDSWLAMARNDWRAAVSLETSQFLVALLPS